MIQSKTIHTFCVIFALIIIPITILNANSPILSYSTEISAKRTQDQMGKSKIIASKPKSIPQTHNNQLQSNISHCSCSEDNWHPVISDLDDFIYYMGMGKQIPILNWSVEDHCPEIYMIYVDAEQVESGSWENGTISWNMANIAGFNTGGYNITIIIQDINGNKASDTVIVEVWDVMMTSPFTPEFYKLRWSILLVLMGFILFYIKVNRGREQ